MDHVNLVSPSALMDCYRVDSKSEEEDDDAVAMLPQMSLLTSAGCTLPEISMDTPAAAQRLTTECEKHFAFIQASGATHRLRYYICTYETMAPASSDSQQARGTAHDKHVHDSR